MVCARRVAVERGEKVGHTVGYQIRLEAVRSQATVLSNFVSDAALTGCCCEQRLLFCTTGILLRRLESDPNLLGVSHVVVDEVHERSIDSDFLLIVLRELLRRRSGADHHRFVAGVC